MPAPSRCPPVIRGRQVDMRLPDVQAADIRWAVLLNVRGGAADAAGCIKKVVSPKGKRLTTFCASLALLHPLLSLTHWIFGSLSLPYKSSSHSAKCVRCASLRPGGGYHGGRKIVFSKARGFRRGAPGFYRSCAAHRTMGSARNRLRLPGWFRGSYVVRCVRIPHGIRKSGEVGL